MMWHVTRSSSMIWIIKQLSAASSGTVEGGNGRFRRLGTLAVRPLQRARERRNPVPLVPVQTRPPCLLQDLSLRPDRASARHPATPLQLPPSPLHPCCHCFPLGHVPYARSTPRRLPLPQHAASQVAKKCPKRMFLSGGLQTRLRPPPSPPDCPEQSNLQRRTPGSEPRSLAQTEQLALRPGPGQPPRTLPT